MAHSSLVGIDRAATTAPGRDSATLGPSDSSDSGSDTAGFDGQDENDLTEPVDVALSNDGHRGSTSSNETDGSASDSAGTGERRSAAEDDGGRDGGDISVDRVFNPSDASEEGNLSESELELIDTADAGYAIQAQRDIERTDPGTQRERGSESASENDVETDATSRQDRKNRFEKPAPDLSQEDGVYADNTHSDADDAEANIDDDATRPDQSAPVRSTGPTTR